MITSKQKIDFKSLLKIYWSISWRANIFAITLYLILFSLFPIALTCLINFDILDTFKKYLFDLYHIQLSAEKIDSPTLTQSLTAGLTSFIIDYLFLWAGFKGVLNQKIYPDFLPAYHPFTMYNKIFLAPLLVCNLAANEIFGLSEPFFTILTYLIYFMMVFYLLKKALSERINYPL